MKKVVGIVLALVLVFAFATVSMAAEEPLESIEEVEIWSDEEIPEEDLYFDDTDLSGNGEGITEEDVLDFVEADKAIDPTLPDLPKYDEIKDVGTLVIDSTTPIPGQMRIYEPTWTKQDLVNIARFFEVGYEIIEDIKYDEAGGYWYFDVDDLDTWSIYIALVQKGVKPAEAAKIASTSPKTADSSTNSSMAIVIMLAASVMALVAFKKARQTA
ncbi:hypothetical protein LJC56_04895 [Christensenellaceae bacterium OttesenSCG-928-K19]|nr:hypothetical protein [Christensenellaceae bacterium OttesenSCG-928-K19]